MNDSDTLAKLGWNPFFQQQLTLEEWDTVQPVRVVAQHRSELEVSGDMGERTIELTQSMPDMVVGDWLLLDSEQRFLRLLDRITCFSRKAAGTKRQKQLISANVDTALIVTSMNEDFNLNRIERFLALTNEAGAQPVIILSKSDLAKAPEDYIKQIQMIDPFLMVEAVNCLDPVCNTQLSPWLQKGSTIAVIGSSGVGKSTLVNTLLGQQRLATGEIRDDDAKGRHTTTSRSLTLLASGAVMLDTPGMREIQLADCKEGLSSTFSDIENYAKHCRFADCNHTDEPDCAVQKAIDSGELDSRRLVNYQKLLREDALNSASLSERRANDKALGKFYKRTLSQSSKLKGR